MRQSICDVTTRRGAKPQLLWKSNKYYIFLCVCVRTHASAYGYERASACMCFYVWVWVHGRVPLARGALLNRHATRVRHIVCGLSGSTLFVDIVS